MRPRGFRKLLVAAILGTVVWSLYTRHGPQPTSTLLSPQNPPRWLDSDVTMADVQEMLKHWKHNEKESMKLRLKISRDVDPGKHMVYYSDLRKNVREFLRLKAQNLTYRFRTPVGHYRTCAIVGNSGILLNSNCGATIDAHDFVSRCNMAPTRGFEKDVGTKTSHMMLNGESLHDLWEDLNDTVRETSRIQKFKTLNGTIVHYSKSRNNNIPRILVGLNDKLKRYLKQYNINVTLAYAQRNLANPVNVLLQRILRQRRWALTPTTGIMTLFLDLTFCDQVTMYGMWPFAVNPRGSPLNYHYYQAGTDQLQNERHTYNTEIYYLASLHKRGVIKLVIEPCQ